MEQLDENLISKIYNPIQKKTKHLGSHDTELEAAIYRNNYIKNNNISNIKINIINE